MDTYQSSLERHFRVACEGYFEHFFKTIRCLYFDLIPHDYFGTDYHVVPINCFFSWQGNAKLSFEEYQGEDHNHGRKQCIFEQQCEVSYSIIVNSIVLDARHTRNLKFEGRSFEPFGMRINIKMIVPEMSLLNELRNMMGDIKQQFEIKSIEDSEFDGKIGFAYYADIIRKTRTIQPSQQQITHGYVYFEIARCHEEIEECLVNALFHQKYASDLMARKIVSGKDTLYLPNFSHTDFKYLLSISSGMDRLYSFWDRITFLLANYDLLGSHLERVSFDSYMRKLQRRIASKHPTAFNSKSANLKWLVDFHQREFKTITDYRHRIVHYQITPKWDGVLSSKFSSNAMEFVKNETELKKLKLEFEGLGNLLLRHFHYCTTGFIKTLQLIDELP